jgi:hypothetical protein
MKNPLNNTLQFRFMYQALLERFGTTDDGKLVNDLVDILNEFDTERNVVLEKLLGIYQRPEQADAKYLWHTGKDLIGNVLEYNEFRGQLHVAYDLPQTENRYFTDEFTDEQDAEGLSYNEWYNLSERERLGYARQEVPTGKYRSTTQWVDIDQLGTKYCDWRVLTPDELIAADISDASQVPAGLPAPDEYVMSA